MVGVRSSLWKSLETWSATVFIVAGGLLDVYAGLVALDALTTISITTHGNVTGLVVSAGVILWFVGLLGLYPRLADRSSRMARAGILLVAFPVISVFVILVWVLLALSLGVPVGSGLSLIPALDIVNPTMFLLFAAGTTIVGIASLRTSVPSPSVGVLLLVLAVPWYAQLAGTQVYGLPFPAWLDVVSFGTMASAALAIGYLLRADADRANRTDHLPLRDSTRE